MFWRHRARRDLEQICLSLGSRSATAPERVLDAFDRTLTLVLRMPRVGRPHGRPRGLRGLRSVVLRGARSYLLFYRPVPDGIEVVRVLHGARDLAPLLDDTDDAPA